MTKTVTTSEANVQRAVCDLLDAKRIFWMRCNAGDRFGETNGKKWRIKGHRPGTADLLAFAPTGSGSIRVGRGGLSLTPDLLPLWIELKAPGKKQSPAQIEFQQDVEARGMTYLLVDSIDVLISWFKDHSL